MANDGVAEDCMAFVDLNIITEFVAIIFLQGWSRPGPDRTTKERAYWIMMAGAAAS